MLRLQFLSLYLASKRFMGDSGEARRKIAEANLFTKRASFVTQQGNVIHRADET